MTKIQAPPGHARRHSGSSHQWVQSISGCCSAPKINRDLRTLDLEALRTSLSRHTHEAAVDGVQVQVKLGGKREDKSRRSIQHLGGAGT